MTSSVELETRILKLERSQARARLLSWVLCGCLALSVGLNYVYSMHRTIIVRELLLKDEAGRVRATLGTNPDGRPLLTLRDDSERPGITLGYNLLHKPGINVGLFGPRTRIGFGEEGLPRLALQDETGQSPIELALLREGRASVRINGTEDPAQWLSP